ncbi:MAG: CopD family protein [Rhodocyclaceae bacterium]|nr:CopD family protein [Rhodocyclaceae bacterium]
MLWVKAFHIVFVVSWFAGLFYLPRIFVNLAMVPAESAAERERLLLMARKLYRFVTPIGLLATALGLWLWFGFGFHGGWLHAKTALVVGLWAYHGFCGGQLRRFVAGNNRRSHTWFRVFNEIPVLALIAIVILAVVKPF